MILVDNKTNIDIRKINKAISLLPKEYSDLDEEIRIYGTLISLTLRIVGIYVIL